MKTHPPSSLWLNDLSLVINIVEPRWSVNPARVFKLCNKQFLKVLHLKLVARLHLSEIQDVDSLASKLIDISPLTSLETLRITIPDIQKREYSSPIIQLFGCIIRRISSTEFHQLVIILKPSIFRLNDSDAPLAKEDWEFLDRAIYAMSSSPFVEVLVPSDLEDWNVHEKMLKEGFARCWKDRRLVLRAHEELGKFCPWP
ncbi:hypothetical protein PM082_012439 [Marasmius tenuissimus]|nr:hypothetical protein PM082_012439 [Marasmius tenuissimus]